jgi:hypothetical protein
MGWKRSVDGIKVTHDLLQVDLFHLSMVLRVGITKSCLLDLGLAMKRSFFSRLACQTKKIQKLPFKADNSWWIRRISWVNWQIVLIIYSGSRRVDPRDDSSDLSTAVS